MTTYVAPAGGSVDLLMGGAYSAPTGGEVLLSLIDYTPPAYNEVSLNLEFSYAPPPSGICSIDIVPETGSNQTIWRAGGIEPGIVGTPVQVAWRKFLYPVSLGDLTGFGTAYLIDARTISLNLADAYTAPSYNAVSINLGGAAGEIFIDGFDAGSWGSPLVEFKNRTIYPQSFNNYYSGQHALVYRQFLVSVSIDQSAFGGATIVNKNRYLLASGINQSAFGTAAAINKNRYLDLETRGINQAGIGTASVINKNTTLYPTGIAGFKGFGFAGDGTGFISFLDRTLNPAGINQAALGGPVVTNQHRYVDLASRGIVATYGTALVAYAERLIYPTFLWAFSSGTPLVGTRRYLEATGIDPGFFGLQYVHDNRQYPMPPGLDATLWGDAWVTRSPRIIEPEGIALRDTLPSEQWGIQTVWNLTQYVGQIFAPGTEDGGVFGSYIWTFVENRNRVIFQYGHKDSAFGPHAIIDNAADPLLPEGISTPLGVPMVAYYIRRVYPTGLEPSWFSPYNALYNTKREVSVAGINQAGIGEPSLVNTRRYYQFYGFEDSTFGTPFVAPAIRALTVPLGPEGYHGYHQVQLAKRYLYPTGFELQMQFGGPYVDERFTIFRPSSILPKPMGEPFIWNATPEIRPMWITNTEWGDTHVRLQYRHVYTEGLLQTEMGRGAIADRTITVIPTGYSALRFGTGLTVRNMIEEPPQARTLQPTGYIASYYGTANVHGNDISPTGFEATRWGSTIVYFLGAYPSGIGPLTNYIPAPWVKGPQWILPVDIPAPDDPRSSQPKTKHDLQPRTIWAQFDAPPEALMNHEGAWELMDRVWDPENDDRPRFGKPTVSLYYRGLLATTWESLLMGMPDLTLRNRAVRPTGIRPKPLGIPVIPHTVTIDVYSGINQGEFGTTYLEKQNREIYPVGLEPPEFADSMIDFYIRYLYPAGWDSFTTTDQHRLHPPEPIIPQGLDATRWGDSWTSNWLRNITPEGFDAGASGYTPGQFRDRMRVTRGTGTSIRARSTPPGSAGTPTVTQASRAPYNDIITAD